MEYNLPSEVFIAQDTLNYLVNYWEDAQAAIEDFLDRRYGYYAKSYKEEWDDKGVKLTSIEWDIPE